MHTTSDGYKKANLEPVRQFESDITIGARKLTNEDLISFTIQQSIQQDETFSIGNVISSCLNLVFLHNDIDTDDRDIINLKLGLLVDDAYEYIPLGTYNINSVDSNDTTTTLVCYDNMVKFDVPYTENNENPTVYSVINRLISLTGVQFGGVLSDYKNYNLTPLQGYSCREVLGFIAGVLGSNATIDRNGKFNFVSLSIHPLYNIERFELATKDGSIVMTKNSEVIEVKAQVGFINADNYYDYTKKNKNYKIKQVVNMTDTEGISLGSTDDNSVCLSMQNPLVNEEILKDIYSKMNGLEFLPYSLNWIGDVSVDVGDLITVTDKKGVMRAHPVLSQTIIYNGALNVISGAQGDTKLANTYVVKTKEEAELDRTQEDLNETINTVNGVKVEINKLQDSIELKVEKSEMESVKEDVSNVKDSVSSINISLDGITQRVSSTEDVVATIDGDITSLENRINSAEQKITDNSIISTVSKEFYKKTEADNKYLTSSSSTITQLSDSIESKVSSDDVKTLVTQNAESWNLSIDGKLKGTNYTFDGDNFTIGNSEGDTTAYHSPARSRWQHSDGSYTEVNSSGLMRFVSGEGQMYHSLIATGTVRVGDGSDPTIPSGVSISLPESFHGKEFQVVLGVSSIGKTSLFIENERLHYNGFEARYVINDSLRGAFTIHGYSKYKTYSLSSEGIDVAGYIDVSYTVIA